MALLLMTPDVSFSISPAEELTFLVRDSFCHQNGRLTKLYGSATYIPKITLCGPEWIVSSVWRDGVMMVEFVK